MRDPRDKFSSVDSVFAAAGVKIVASDIEGAMAGTPLYAVAPEKPLRNIRSDLRTKSKGFALPTN